MKKSIYKKIRKQVIIGSAVAALAVSLAAIISLSIMRDNIINTSHELGISAAEDSKVALEYQMEQSLYHLANNKTAISDEKLSAVVNMVTVVADNAETILNNPGSFLPQIPGFPDASNEGIAVAQLRLADEHLFTKLEHEIGLIGNLSEILVSVYRSLDYVTSVYIGTESGISLSADKNSNLKTNIFDPRVRGWYQRGVAVGELAWSDVFVDNSGRGLGIACVMPFYDTKGNLLGVAGAGMLLDVLNGIVLDTVIGERGIKLSGGQKQRIVLARQFLRDVEVLLFDEATSALDQYSESIIQDAIESIGKAKTIIIVAHRKSSLALCDRIIEL